MLRSGRTNAYRRVLFVLVALSSSSPLSPTFSKHEATSPLPPEIWPIAGFHSAHGHSDGAHTAAFTKTIIFPRFSADRLASIGSMVVLWLAGSLTLGRGWCSWVCFFGGMDEAAPIC